MVSTILSGAGLVLSFLKDRGARSVEYSKTIMQDLHNSWKDEYVTVLVTFPMLVMLLSACVGWTEMQERMILAVDDLDRFPPYYQELMFWVIVVAAGLQGLFKPFKK